MSKDNREECENKLKEELLNFVDLHDWNTACKTSAFYTGFHMINVFLDGEVTTDSGADECEWVEGDRLYETSCNEVSYNYDRSWEFCPYCGKKITIKGE